MKKRTYADLRRVALALVKSNNGAWSDYLVEHGMIHAWAAKAKDAEVTGWLDHLRPAEAARGAAWVGAAYGRKPLLAYAERKSDDSLTARTGIVAAWWKLGRVKEAAAAWTKLVPEVREYLGGNQANHTLFTAAALGGAWDHAHELVASCFADDTYRDDLIIPGVLACLDDQPKLFTAILKKWSACAESGFTNTDLALGLSRRFADEPWRYVELLLQWPKVIESDCYGSRALRCTEVQDPARAAKLAASILDEDSLGFNVKQVAFAVLAHGARTKRSAEIWAKRNLTADQHGYYAGHLAALGRVDEVRTLIARNEATTGHDIAQSTTDRALAVEALSAAFARDASPYLVVRLVDLGERDRAKELLDAEHARIKKLKKRSPDCARLAEAAATAGFVELGMAALALPGKLMRPHTADALVGGFASAGDFDHALEALEQVPDGDSNGRVSTAVQRGLRTADEAPFTGPRAFPLRV